MNRRKYITYSSMLFGSIPYYIQDKYFMRNLNKEHSVWDINYMYNPFRLNKIDINVTNELQIHTINVAQSNATLINTPNNKNVLIDSGHYYHRSRYVMNYLNSYNINNIDYLILTHPHWDHIGGVKNILNKYNIKNILYTGQKHDTKTYDEFISQINKFKYKVQQIREGDEFNIDSKLNIQVMNPQQKLNPNNSINNNNLVLRISYNRNSILLPADAEKETEKRLINKYGDELNSDIYKVGHHGDKQSSTPEFLNKVNPKTAIISAAYYSEFGYPDKETLKRLHDKNIDTYWTGIDGSIVATSDGSEWNIYTQSEKETPPLELKKQPQINYPPSSGFKS